MWELDHKEGWVLKNWCFQIVEKALERPLDCKEIKPVNPKRNQPWIFIGRTMLKLKLQYFDHLIQRANSLEKTDAGKDWGQEEKEAAEGEMVRQHHQLNGHEFEQTLRRTEEPGVLQSMGSQKVKHVYTYGWVKLSFDRKTTKFCKAIILQLKNRLIFFKVRHT